MARGVYTLKGVWYRDEFGRRGSLELHHLIPVLAEEVRTSSTAPCILLSGPSHCMSHNMNVVTIGIRRMCTQQSKKVLKIHKHKHT